MGSPHRGSHSQASTLLEQTLNIWNPYNTGNRRRLEWTKNKKATLHIKKRLRKRPEGDRVKNQETSRETEEVRMLMFVHTADQNKSTLHTIKMCDYQFFCISHSTFADPPSCIIKVSSHLAMSSQGPAFPWFSLLLDTTLLGSSQRPSCLGEPSVLSRACHNTYLWRSPWGYTFMYIPKLVY